MNILCVLLTHGIRKNILGILFFQALISSHGSDNICNLLHFCINRIGGIMVSVLASSAASRRFEPRSVQTKAIKLIFVASPL